MKILYIAYSCDPFNGSEDQIGWNIPFESAKSGNDVYVITKEEQRNNIEKYCYDNKYNKIKFIFVDIPIIFKKLYKGFFYSGRLSFWMKKALNISQKLCKDNKIDIIHQITPVEFRMIGNFKKVNNIKYIVGPIGGGVNTPDVFKYYAKERRLIEIIRKFINFIFSLKYKTCNIEKKCDYILYSNEETANIIEKNKFDIGKLYTEIGICDTNICDYSKKKSTNIIKFVVVGRLIYLKGHDFLLDVIEKVSTSKRFMVNIIGDGPKFAQINKRVKSSKVLSERVRLLGKVDFNRINEIYDEAHILILPSIRENTGTVVLEAMSRGLPVILYNGFGGKLLVNKNNGWLYSGNNLDDTINSFVGIIEDILNNPEIIYKKSKNAIAEANLYTWDKKMKKFNKIYRKVLEEKNEK